MVYMPRKNGSEKIDFVDLEEELGDTKLVKKDKSESKIDKSEVVGKVVKFTNIARKQYGNIVKSVLIFGSAARKQMKKNSDIDVWVVLDDTATKGSSDFSRVSNHLQLNLQLILKVMVANLDYQPQSQSEDYP